MKTGPKQKRLADALKKNLLKRKQQKQKRQINTELVNFSPEQELEKTSIQKLSDPLAKL